MFLLVLLFRELLRLAEILRKHALHAAEERKQSGQVLGLANRADLQEKAGQPSGAVQVAAIGPAFEPYRQVAFDNGIDGQTLLDFDEEAGEPTAPAFLLRGASTKRLRCGGPELPLSPPSIGI